MITPYYMDYTPFLQESLDPPIPAMIFRKPETPYKEEVGLTLEITNQLQIFSKEHVISELAM